MGQIPISYTTHGKLYKITNAEIRIFKRIPSKFHILPLVFAIPDVSYVRLHRMYLLVCLAPLIAHHDHIFNIVQRVN